MTQNIYNASTRYSATKDWGIERREIEDKLINSKNVFGLVQGEHTPVNANHRHYEYAADFLKGYRFPLFATDFMASWRPKEWVMAAEAILLALRMGRIPDPMPFQCFLAAIYCTERVVTCCSQCGLPYGFWCGE